MEKQTLPNSTLVLVMGILSIIGCCCYGFPGIIFGIIALVVGKNATTIYNENPDSYLGFPNVKAGKIMAIIGIVISVIYIALIIFMISYFGWDAIQDPELLRERLEELQGIN